MTTFADHAVNRDTTLSLLSALRNQLSRKEAGRRHSATGGAKGQQERCCSGWQGLRRHGGQLGERTGSSGRKYGDGDENSFSLLIAAPGKTWLGGGFNGLFFVP